MPLMPPTTSFLLGFWKWMWAAVVIAAALGMAHPSSGFAADERLTLAEVLQTGDTGATETEQAELRAIYDGVGGAAIWTTTPRRLTLIKLLTSLEADGIDVQDLGTQLDLDTGLGARADVMATWSILRAAHIIAGQRADPTIIPGWSLKVPDLSVVQSIITAVRNDRVQTLFDDLRPTADAYRALRVAYLRYRSLAAEAWPALDTSGEVRVDANDARLPEVARRLIILGDLSEGDTTRSTLPDAIRHFQRRHGLAVDGRVGRATLSALNVPPAARATQIAANLEYWRRLPRVWPTRYIAVNAAAAELAFVNAGAPTYTSRVIVGDPRHPTPIMTANITAVTFNPSWTIPYSIATKEILPRLRRDRTYLERSNIAILGRETDPFGLQVDWPAYSRTNFPFELRQKPGPHNALGVVKFEMPNKFDVYLHDTPDRSLFAREARTLSHGCVRVDSVQDLAQRLIEDPAIWLESNLKSAIAEGRTVTVPLASPIPVYLLYLTAYAGEEGIINFRPDVYGRDRAVGDATRTQLFQGTTAPNLKKGS